MRQPTRLTWRMQDSRKSSASAIVLKVLYFRLPLSTVTIFINQSYNLTFQRIHTWNLLFRPYFSVIEPAPFLRVFNLEDGPAADPSPPASFPASLTSTYAAHQRVPSLVRAQHLSACTMWFVLLLGSLLTDTKREERTIWSFSMIMKWLTVEHSPILDFGGEYLIRQSPS